MKLTFYCQLFFISFFLAYLLKMLKKNQYFYSMKNIGLLLILSLLLLSCNSAKRNQRLLAQGDYAQAIELAVKKLQRNKVASRNDTRIRLLEDAFKKMVIQDERRISFLKKQGNAANAREIFYTFQNLDDVQNLIEPLLPLYSEQMGRDARFQFKDYSAAIIKAKADYVANMYEEAQRYENRNTTEDFRTAYHIYCEIQEIEPNYKDVVNRRTDAKFYGTDFVLVSLNNQSNILIPQILERELLNFNTYGLDQYWTEYHSNPNNNIDYNYGIALNFQQIAISPEQILERQERRSKRVKDGWEYVLDANGNVKKDSLGNDIKRDRFVTVSANLNIVQQSKAVSVGGAVVYRDFRSGRNINSYPLGSEFIFENIFATYRGDERALTPEDKRLLNNQFVPFPPNEQMVFDAGEDIKLKLKQILTNNRIVN